MAAPPPNGSVYMIQLVSPGKRPSDGPVPPPKRLSPEQEQAAQFQTSMARVFLGERLYIRDFQGNLTWEQFCVDTKTAKYRDLFTSFRRDEEIIGIPIAIFVDWTIRKGIPAEILKSRMPDFPVFSGGTLFMSKTTLFSAPDHGQFLHDLLFRPNLFAFVKDVHTIINEFYKVPASDSENFAALEQRAIDGFTQIVRGYFEEYRAQKPVNAQIPPYEAD
jgi:hypothetical protein